MPLYKTLQPQTIDISDAEKITVDATRRKKYFYRDLINSVETWCFLSVDSNLATQIRPVLCPITCMIVFTREMFSPRSMRKLSGVTILKKADFSLSQRPSTTQPDL